MQKRPEKKHFHLGSVHTLSEKLQHAALFLRLGLPSTLIRRENGAFHFENAIQTGGSRKRRLEHFETELFENDGVAIIM